ncbi:MAG: group I truncated hemoglobin [Nitrospiraceae bacterium]
MMGYLKSFVCSVLAGGALITLGACAQQSGIGSSSRPGAIASTASLYDRLGGKPAITAVVDQFVANVAADSRINARFATTDIPKLKGHLVDQVCGATGGPCTYKGRDMKTTHAGMRITNDEFNALVQDLVAALDKFNVPLKEKNELLALLAPMKKDIVEAP